MSVTAEVFNGLTIVDEHVEWGVGIVEHLL